jgi:hypothetical protein
MDASAKSDPKVPFGRFYHFLLPPYIRSHRGASGEFRGHDGCTFGRIYEDFAAYDSGFWIHCCHPGNNSPVHARCARDLVLISLVEQELFVIVNVMHS